MAKRFNVATPKPKYNQPGETWWHRVGSAWQNEKGLITVYLDSYPIPDKDGVVKMMLFEPKDEDRPASPKQEPARSTKTYAEELDDEIPF